MSRAEVETRLGQVAESYKSKQRQQPKPNRRLGDLRKLFKHRGLSDDEVEAAIAPLSPHLYVHKTEFPDDDVNLTAREKIELDIRSFDCWPMYQQRLAERFYRLRRRRRDRDAKRAERARLPKGLSQRSRELLDELIVGKQWQSIAILTDRSAGLKSFRKRNGRRLDYHGRKQAVHRAVTELHKADQVRLDKVDGQRGQELVVRWNC